MMHLEFEVGDKVRVRSYGAREFTVEHVDHRPDGTRRYKVRADNGRLISGVHEVRLNPALVPMKQAISDAVDRLYCGGHVPSLSEVARKLAERSSPKTCTCTGWQLLHRGHLDTCPRRDNG